MPPRACSSCGQEKGRGEYTATQWQSRTDSDRLCRECLSEVWAEKNQSLFQASPGKWGGKDCKIGGVEITPEDLPPISGRYDMAAIASLAAAVTADSVDIISGRLPQRPTGLKRDPVWEENWWRTGGPEFWHEVQMAHPDEKARPPYTVEHCRKVVMKIAADRRAGEMLKEKRAKDAASKRRRRAAR